VWLFEGPRKARRAEECFPGAVTTANAGGASAIKQTDLSPLRRRDVILWRDSDEAGVKWQEHMIAALRAVDVASVRVVNIAVLPPEMLRGIPEAKRGKFDVVDLIEAGIAAEAVGAAAEAACESAAMCLAVDRDQSKIVSRFAGRRNESQRMNANATAAPINSPIPPPK
jgi:hypothetical protein